MSLTKYINLASITALLFLILAAQITIDVGTIPVTGQTLAVLMISLLLPPRDVLAVLSSYLILGMVGAPVFADGASGISKITGGSGGFLIGFLISGLVISSLAYRSQLTLPRIVALTTIGTLIIIIFGVVRLATMYGFPAALDYGFYPFWQGAIIKILVGSLGVWGVRKYITKGV